MTNAHRTLLLLSFSTLLAACGSVQPPAQSDGLQPVRSGTLHALDDCHSCATGNHTGSVERFTLWTSVAQTAPQAGEAKGSGVSELSTFWPVHVPISVGSIIYAQKSLIHFNVGAPINAPEAQSLPLACRSPDGVERPVEFGGNWSGHSLKFTPPQASVITTQGAADQSCAAAFGPGWSVLTVTGDSDLWAVGEARWSDKTADNF